MRVLNEAFEQPQRAEEHAALPLAGGIMQYGYQCGMIWGATMAAGARAYQLYGSGPKAEAKAIKAAERIVESFRGKNKHINCFEITNINKDSSRLQMIMFFLIKGGSIGCIIKAGKYAKAILPVIEKSLGEDNIEPPSPPVSCAAMLAQKMGASERQTVMAAGLAGGIGLCGGGCGALGAAIWLAGLKSIGESDAKIDFGDPKLMALMEKFLKQADYKFECSEIVGRKFSDINDHAKYLQDGGCSQLIEELATG